MQLRSIKQEDYPQLSAIFKQGIDTGLATFQTEIIDWEVWNKEHLNFGRIAAFDNDKMMGWTALTPISGRCVYAGVAEVSVYIDAAHRGRGIGKALLLRLIEESEQSGIWTLQSGILADNEPSIQLHEHCGFRKVGLREKIGKLHGVWKDVVMMERRNKIGLTN